MAFNSVSKTCCKATQKKNARNNKENMMKRQNKIKISRKCYFFNENVCIVSSGVFFFAYKVNVNIEIPVISAQMPTWLKYKSLYKSTQFVRLYVFTYVCMHHIKSVIIWTQAPQTACEYIHTYIHITESTRHLSPTLNA